MTGSVDKTRDALQRCQDWIKSDEGQTVQQILQVEDAANAKGKKAYNETFIAMCRALKAALATPSSAVMGGLEYDERKAVMLLRDIVGRGLLDVYAQSKMAVERYLAGYDHYRKHNPATPSSATTDRLDLIARIDALKVWIEEWHPVNGLDALASLNEIRTAFDGGNRAIGVQGSKS